MTASIFRRLPAAVDEAGAGEEAAVTILVDGKPLAARRGDSVAAALLAAGHIATRKAPVGGQPRGPYCLMGVCFECLMEIDGEGGRQACLVPVREGLEVRLGGGEA